MMTYLSRYLVYLSQMSIIESFEADEHQCSFVPSSLTTPGRVIVHVRGRLVST